ncbi:MAG: mechanosensitive ion channel [Nitrosomonadales bacterium]|jgi:small-conductance mechanosensitive channel|nr:mechanosensitive ion channel [Nitrosomonadales bacterium]MBT3918590.1 mechanosensitive ion channel [Nitrosomonadales bacterium]MBT4183394.1 mechanosensitive ion channel [Nitrosomonadales bacterium]MBT4571555.1 mechanosensitive ion channel [Nitrosomonadales bacterium]MBT6015323.1 mechanosensitive ion channel [Nitrosomonadales bacterium]
MNLEYTQMQSNLFYLKNNFTLETLVSWGFISQLLLVIMVIGMAFLVENLIRKKLKKNHAKSLKQKDIFKIFRPILMLSVLFAAMYFMREGELEWRLLYFANSVLIILVFVRLAIILTRHILKPGPWLRAFENIFAGIVVLGYLALQFGIVKQIQDRLHSIKFEIGKESFTLLLIVESILGIFIAILIAMIVARFIENKIMNIRSRNFRMNQRMIATRLLKILLYIFAVILVLDTLGVNLSFLTFFSGAFGLGLAFGLQKIASNYVSGFLLLSDESIRVGDMIEVGGAYGRVEAIKSRYTAIRRLDGFEILIPNEQLLTSEITNLTFSNTTVKVPLDVQISYESSIDKAIEVILKVCNAEGRIVKDPKPDVYVKEFADSGINLHIACFVADPDKGFLLLKSDIYRAIFNEFKNNDIEIPYPHRVNIPKK